jgi:hypothetical protein
MEDVRIFYGHLVHFKVFCFILWTFGIARSNLVYFPPFFVFSTKKNLATLPPTHLRAFCFENSCVQKIEVLVCLATQQRRTCFWQPRRCVADASGSSVVAKKTFLVMLAQRKSLPVAPD